MHGAIEYERCGPDDLEAAVREAPVAYVPLGTYEHHGWHLPIGFDGLKAHRLCRLAAGRTGGVVLPVFWYGTGGGHRTLKWSVIVDEGPIRALIDATVDRLARFGFRVIVLFTGHYPPEQTAWVRDLAAERTREGLRVLGLTDGDLTTPLPGDAYPGDHAAKYETSIGLALDPEWVKLDRLTAGRDPAAVTLDETRRGDEPVWDPTHPVYAIWGDDPRPTAGAELGRRFVDEIVSRLVAQVEAALAGRAG